jgi:hypothetical protein
MLTARGWVGAWLSWYYEGGRGGLWGGLLGGLRRWGEVGRGGADRRDEMTDGVVAGAELRPSRRILFLYWKVRHCG